MTDATRLRPARSSVRRAWVASLLVLATAASGDVTLAALGDVLPARGIATRVNQHGAAWLWDGVRPLLAGADLRFANLECAVTERGEPLGRPFAFRAAPTLARQVLATGGVDVVSVANNHSYDYGPVGLLDTLESLAAAGVVAAGAGRDRTEAITSRVVIHAGLKVGLVAYTVWPGACPAGAEPALAVVDEATWADELRAAHTGVDVLVVSVHWGTEYQAAPDSTQRRLAHAAVEAGADAVIGHGPHVRQGLETYRGRPIVYSLGNALFDRDDPRYSSGWLVTLRLGPGRAALDRAVPLRLRDGRPFPEHPSRSR